MYRPSIIFLYCRKIIEILLQQVSEYCTFVSETKQYALIHASAVELEYEF